MRRKTLKEIDGKQEMEILDGKTKVQNPLFRVDNVPVMPEIIFSSGVSLFFLTKTCDFIFGLNFENF